MTSLLPWSLPWPKRMWSEEREQTWCNLEQWLKLNYSGEVLMPAPLGEKKPAYTHSAGSWTWARYDWTCSQRSELAAKDVGILLRDLCVVDVDTVADADALEARFPELLAVPAEATARGRHYFFTRSATADKLGYYDGAKQRTPTVDFKTRAWGGGSGFVVVAPSTNKVRAVAMQPPVAHLLPDAYRPTPASAASSAGCARHGRCAPTARCLPSRMLCWTRWLRRATRPCASRCAFSPPAPRRRR